jgi:L-threonylcarbamoyladenylate synthase
VRIELEEAACLIKQGEVVAVPTDTVYGLAASLSCLEGIQKAFTTKRRPPSNPLIIQVSKLELIIPFVFSFPPDFEKLANHFWPGALTLVIPINPESIPSIVRAGLLTAGFRIPGHPLMRELLRQTGPLVVPSANLSGRPAATSAQQVEEEFGSHFPVLDGGICEKGIASTLLAYENSCWKIIRQGEITAQDIQPILHSPCSLNTATFVPGECP